MDPAKSDNFLIGLPYQPPVSLTLHLNSDAGLPALKKRLLELIQQADGEAGWEIFSTARSVAPDIIGKGLALRNLQAISYNSTTRDTEEESLGWHSDGHTLF